MYIMKDKKFNNLRTKLFKNYADSRINTQFLEYCVDNKLLENKILCGMSLRDNTIFKLNSFQDNMSFSGKGSSIAARFIILQLLIKYSNNIKLFIYDPKLKGIDYPLGAKKFNQVNIKTNEQDFCLLINSLFDDFKQNNSDKKNKVILINKADIIFKSTGLNINNNYNKVGTIENKLYQLCNANKLGYHIILTSKDELNSFLNNNIIQCFNYRVNLSNNIKDLGKGTSSLHSGKKRFFFISNETRNRDIDYLLNKYLNIIH